MRLPPADLAVGDELDQSGIEAVFDTGFGYQISGINPRRDDADDRYVLLFANERGPYGDAVSEGAFEYIGEGLQGDQSLDSPGNSVLADAVGDPVPIHFFYKRDGADAWTYQGEVDVRDYRFEERDGRRVVVFEMEHRENGDRPETAAAHATGLFLVPVNDDWLPAFRRTVETPVGISDADAPAALRTSGGVRVWGTTEATGAKKRAAVDALAAGDCVLFYHDGGFVAGGVVGDVFHDSALGERLWDSPASRHVFTLDDYTTDVPAVETVWDALGYDGRPVVQGFSRVADDRLDGLRDGHQALRDALFDTGDDALSEVDVREERDALLTDLDDEPALTADTEAFTTRERRVRDRAFSSVVRKAYDYHCAICGSRRETPAGSFEVEAAHVYPKSENGSDDPRNGIALCKLHHWAFDAGWLALTDACEVLVADAPTHTGYREFVALDGRRIRLPDDDRLHPHETFLAAHRRLHGFEE